MQCYMPTLHFVQLLLSLSKLHRTARLYKCHRSSCLCLQAAERALDIEEAALGESAGDLAQGGAPPPPLQRHAWPADELMLPRGGLEACECGAP